MNIKNFIAGNFIKQYKYKSFSPNFINNEWILNDNSVINLLSDANIKIGELNAFSELIPDINFFIKMHVNKEAAKSSQIEGTQTNISELLQKKENIIPERKDDWTEVKNYVNAMNRAIKRLNKLPLSNRLIKEIHSDILRGVRGKHKQPGEFRKSQNWIGGASINDSVFIPPHYTELPDLLSDFEKFLNNNNLNIPDLIRIAIAHYQFETIHPFLDGNGRVGRLLITLYMVQKKLLNKPTLYLSDFFEKHKILYYDNLMKVRLNNNLIQWLKFFLEGVKQTATNSIQTFKSIIKIREKIENKKILTLNKKIELARNFIHYLYKQPVVDTKQIEKNLEISPTTVMRLINDFMRLKILKEITGNKRNRIFVFEEYLNLFE